MQWLHLQAHQHAKTRCQCSGGSSLAGATCIGDAETMKHAPAKLAGTPVADRPPALLWQLPSCQICFYKNKFGQ